MSCTLNYNVLSKGTTQYENYDFSSMGKFNSDFIGVSDEGIFILEGEDDDGIPIDAYVKPLKTDFGISNPKKLRAGYLGYEVNGDLLVTVKADEGEEYTATLATGKEGQQEKKFPLPRDIKGTYIEFKISNVNGCDFGIDSLACCIIVYSEGL